MAKIPGGITSRPAGKLGNIIFGAARTPEGKVATAREAVDPSNPQTAEQQSQRSRFRQALDMVQAFGPAIYQEDWNRSVGQLPGFQSLQSIFLNNIDASDVLQAPSVRPLGNLHFPDTFTVTTSSLSSQIEVAFSAETGDNGTTSDEVVTAFIEAEHPSGRDRDIVAPGNSIQRDGGSDDQLVGQADTQYVAVAYLRGAGAADGLLSPAHWFTVTSAA